MKLVTVIVMNDKEVQEVQLYDGYYIYVSSHRTAQLPRNLWQKIHGMTGDDEPARHRCGLYRQSTSQKHTGCQSETKKITCTSQIQEVMAGNRPSQSAMYHKSNQQIVGLADGKEQLR